MMADGARTDLMTLPDDLPAPKDDGACDHLKGGTVSYPSLPLPSTSGDNVDISNLPGLNIVFCYPRSGEKDKMPPPEWNEIPGARGCTPQACSFRDTAADFSAHGVQRIFGISTQDTPYQRELRDRVHLPYHLLSDEKLALVKAMKLPTFHFDGMTLIRRMALAVQDGKIVKVWYPVFPPDRSAGEVLEWLKERTNGQT